MVKVVALKWDSLLCSLENTKSGQTVLAPRESELMKRDTVLSNKPALLPFYLVSIFPLSAGTTPPESKSTISLLLSRQLIGRKL